MGHAELHAQCRKYWTGEIIMMTEKKQYLSIRLSHLLTHCSVGSVVRGPDYLMIIQDVRNWTNRDGSTGSRELMFVEQVKSALGIEQSLREPPIAQLDKYDTPDGACIPASRFPAWTACVKCGLMHYKPWFDQKTNDPVCLDCNKKYSRNVPLSQVSLVLVHTDGYISDLDWHFLAHKNANTPSQQQCGRAQGTLILKNNKTVKCKACNSAYTVRAGERLPYISWIQPWIKEHPPLKESADLSNSSKDSKKLAHSVGEVMEVNDTRIHRSVTTSALVIPPESRIERESIVSKLYCSPHLRQRVTSAKSRLQQKSSKRQLAAELFCTVEDIEDALIQIEDGFPFIDKNLSKLKLLESEYQAILEPIPDLKEDEDFVTNHLTDAWHALLSNKEKSSLGRKLELLIDNVIEISKLKEVMVFKGFTRGGETEDGEVTVVPPAITEETEWLPALELYGEGIFISFNEDILYEWEKTPVVQKRTQEFISRYEKTNIKFDPDLVITPRFMFLHALSHLLIKELEIQAGYPSASLKERIYASQSEDLSMAGILIYVAIPDVDGTLGGLAELAQPQRLERVISKAFEKARWCSLDPVCASHEGQGIGMLNKAACHACELLPETSCFCGNILLDRIFIKGDDNINFPSILSLVKP